MFKKITVGRFFNLLIKILQKCKVYILENILKHFL